MSFKVNLKRTSRQILLDLIGKSNGVQLAPGALVFGTPITIEESQSAGSNTKVPVQADQRRVTLKGGDEFFYNRLPLEDVVGDATLEMPSSGSFHTLDSALKKVFEDLDLGLTGEDFLPQSLAGHGHTVPYNMSLTVSPNSLAYTGGTFDVGWALFDQLVASAGPKSCRYDLRRMDAVFQDAVGTTPVTGSGQPLGRLTDLFGKGNHASQPTITARPEYWVDPTTNEPVSWYDFTDDKLLWPGVSTADGTVGIAFSTGAQVFDLVAPAHIPPGPMIELMFFDRTLSDIECAVLQCYLDLQVKDTSWLGYVRGTSFDIYLDDYMFWRTTSPKTKDELVAIYNQAKMYVEFSKDGRVQYPAPAIASNGYVEVYAEHTTSVARQRFKIGAKDYSYPLAVTYDSWNWWLTWTPDCTAKIKALFPNATSWDFSITFGCLHLMRRGDNPVLPTEYVTTNNFSPTFRYYGKPFASGYALPSGLKVIDDQSVFQIFSPGFVDLSNVEDSLLVLNIYNKGLTIFNPSLSAVDFSVLKALNTFELVGVNLAGAPLPTLPSTLRLRINIANCNIGGSIPPDFFSKITDLRSVILNHNQLTGVIPSLNLPAGLGYIYIYNNQLTGYAGGGVKIVPNYNGWHYFQNNLLTQAAVDLLISDYLAAAQVTTNTTGSRLYLNGTGNAAPSVQGKANAATLRTLGWTVLHNN